MKNRNSSKNPVKRTAILNAAETIFSERGFHEATISEIAKLAKVSEATIYEYFNSKEELLFSLPADKSIQHLKKNQELLPYIQGAANKIRLLVCRHLQLYEHNPDYARVVMLILKTNRNFMKTDGYKHVQESARLTIEVIEEGIKSGEFRPDTKPYLIRAMLYGTIEHLVIRKSLTGIPDDLLSLVDDITNTVLRGILTPQTQGDLRIHVTMDTKANP